MKLNFVRQGAAKDSAPCVILLHGLFGSLANLNAIGKALSASFCIYQVDLRNHGHSPHSPQMDYSSMAEDIIELMKIESLEQVSLIGHSMGGKVAMQLALNFPERINKLIVADIAPVTYPRQHSIILEGLQALEATEIHSRKQADELLAQFIDEIRVRAFLLKNLYRNQSGSYQLRLNVTAISEHYQTLTGAPEGNPFHGPTLFIKGKDSAYIQNKHKISILNLFPNARIKIITGAGHWLHSDKPDTFNRLVLQFLSKR